MVAGRVQLAWPVLPIKMETHGNQKWANEVKETTNGLKKVFINSYRHTANYWFYTKEPAHYFRNYKGRHNHFELLQKNTDLSFSKIALIHDRSKES